MAEIPRDDPTAPAPTSRTELPATPAEVWEALTSPTGVEQWLGEGSELLPVEGAALDVADVETGIRKHGRVDDVEPGRRLGYVWWPADGDDPGTAATRVAIELVPHEGGTTLVVTETPHQPGRASASTSAVTPADSSAWCWRFGTVATARWCRIGLAVLPG